MADETPLPTSWTNPLANGRRMFVRTTPTRHIMFYVAALSGYRTKGAAGYFYASGNTIAEALALCREVRARFVRGAIRLSPKQVAILNRFDPPPCPCGRGPGLYIIGVDVFCRHCRRKAEARFTKHADLFNARADALQSRVYDGMERTARVVDGRRRQHRDRTRGSRG